MTRDELWAQFGAPAAAPVPPPDAPAAPAPDTSAPALVQMLQGGLSQPMTRDEMLAAYSPSDPRESFAAGMVAGVPGTEAFNQRAATLQEANPNTYAAGIGTGAALGLATGGPGLVRAAAKIAPLAGEMAVRGAAPVVKYGWAPAHAVHGDLAGAYAVYRGGKALSTLGQAMKAARTGGDVGKIAESLSPEDISKLFEVLKRSHH